MSKTPKILLAFLLGILSLLLFFFLGEAVSIPSGIPAGESIHLGVSMMVMGTYFFVSAYFLTRRYQTTVWKHWPTILALTVTQIVAALIALVVEPNKSAAMLGVGTAILALAFSCVGAAVAARSVHH